MRVLLSLAAVLLSAQGVHAQDWSGPYVGFGGGAFEPADGEFRTVVIPLRDPRLIYTLPPSRLARYGSDFDNAVFGSAHAGWRARVGPLVGGMEVQGQYGGARSRHDSGILIQDVELPFEACGTPALGCLYGFTDIASATARIEGTTSLKASIGVPVTGRLLVSAYVGPSVAFGELTLDQLSVLGIGVPRPPGSGCMIGCSIPITTDSPRRTSVRAENDTALGVVAGVTADYKITENLLGRVELGYARYEALRLEGDAFETQVWAQPVAFTGSVGVSVRF